MIRTSERLYRGWSLPWLTLTVAGVLVALHGLLGPAPEGLVYDRAKIGTGEIWRLVSGHLVHVDGLHLTWNLVAVLVLGSLAEGPVGLDRRSYLTVLGIGILAIDAWLAWARPELARYCGFSGPLNALMATIIVEVWRRAGGLLPWLLVVGVLGKIALEAGAGTALFAQTQWPPIPTAHAVGLLVGLLTGLLAAWPRPTHSRRNSKEKCSVFN